MKKTAFGILLVILLVSCATTDPNKIESILVTEGLTLSDTIPAEELDDLMDDEIALFAKVVRLTGMNLELQQEFKDLIYGNDIKLKYDEFDDDITISQGVDYDDNLAFTISILLSEDSPNAMLFDMLYFGSSWLFIDSITMQCGDRKYSMGSSGDSTFGRRSVLNGGYVAEQVITIVDDELAGFLQHCIDSDSKFMIRARGSEGTRTGEFTSEVKDIEFMLHIYKILNKK